MDYKQNNLLAIACHELLDQYLEKENNGAGGNLHIVVDDGNLEDKDVDFCIALCEEKQDVLGLLIAKILRELTPEDRDRLLCGDNTELRESLIGPKPRPSMNLIEYRYL